MAEKTFRVPQVDERGHLTGAALEGVRELIPAGGADGWTAERQAKAQGFWVEHSTEPPAEETKYGVPVVWLREGTFTEPTPVKPYRPNPNYRRRTITIPLQAGLSWKIDGEPASPGEHVVPGDAFTPVAVTAEASDNFKLAAPGSWPFQFGSLKGRVLVASDVFAGREGEILIPPVPEENRAGRHPYAIRDGARWNNAAGGTAEVRWNQHGVGEHTIGGVVKPDGWVVGADGAAVNTGIKNLEASLVFNTGTPNVSVEIEVSEVTASTPFTLIFGQPKQAMNSTSKVHPSVRMNADGTSVLDERTQDGVVSTINAGSPIGVWRFDCLDGRVVITAPSGERAVQDFSPLAPSEYGPYSKLFIGESNAVKIKSFKLYASPSR